MGRRDFRRREPKKPKKGEQKSKPISTLVPQVEVEVIRKKRKPAEELEE
ncbi:MAG: hypothetical protein OEU97_06635 [Dehalococcoidia bacterium]|nr:hypothetical protein [Dehalococcoidia bacterium]MDH4367729.1 hypothetical protein [Dehalococcoidia bacterium]